MILDVDRVVQLQSEATERWHREPIDCPHEGYLGLVCKQHGFNFELWHQEDIARSPSALPDQIAQVKRVIDRLNQSRNDTIEKLDDWLADELVRLEIRPKPEARLNTETPGSVIDRLSILALRSYHYQEQMGRRSVQANHRARMEQRIELCRQQQHDLVQAFKELISDITQGVRRHKTYRQMKMYNDPSLNPYLYAAQETQDKQP